MVEGDAGGSERERGYRHVSQTIVGGEDILNAELTPSPCLQEKVTH